MTPNMKMSQLYVTNAQENLKQKVGTYRSLLMVLKFNTRLN